MANLAERRIAKGSILSYYSDDTCEDLEVSLFPVNRNEQNLYTFLSTVKRRMQASNFEAWVKCELLSIFLRNGNYWIELIENNSAGKNIAKVGSVLWPTEAGVILNRFRNSTGSELSAHTKVLIRVRATFHELWGFKLQILDIDPSYTLGDLEARKQAIRDQLKRERIWEQNKRLPAPSDYFHVAVIASPTSAGVGDFRVIANVLEQVGLCEFTYFDAVMQGDRAPDSICSALNLIKDIGAVDLVVILRGGGATSDLLAFNDEKLVRAVASFSIPIMAAVGHERDKNLVDEVAWKACANPKEASVEIKETIVARGLSARELGREIAQIFISMVELRESQLTGIENLLRFLPIKLRKTADGLEREKLRIVRKINVAINSARQRIYECSAVLTFQPLSKVRTASRVIDEMARAVGGATGGSIARSRAWTSRTLLDVSKYTANLIKGSRTGLSRTTVEISSVSCHLANNSKLRVFNSVQNITQNFFRVADRTKAKVEQFHAGILPYHPRNTLRQGYALIKDPVTKRFIGQTKNAASLSKLVIQFADGELIVKNEKG